MQDNVAERLKTFTMRKPIIQETVTTASTNIQTNNNNHSAINSKFSSTSSLSTAPSSRPNSHHRRRSSVSTRRESAEMMGVSANSLADLPSSDDGDTSSIRKRALWALEGKRGDQSPTVVGGLGKVEIPELSSDEKSPVGDRNSFSMASMGLSNTLVKRDSLGRDRDSYGRIISQALSLKDQLHTLLEEEEEEEEEESIARTVYEPVHSPAASSSTSASHPQTKSTPSSTSRNRLKPLTLSTSVPFVPASKTASIPTNLEIASKRRSSLSYRRSDEVNSISSNASNPSHFARHFNPLPTPETTPTTSERPLSPSEQAFLFNNQASLLHRISELERVLASRSRPMSFVSTSSRQLSTSSIMSEPQSDEMLRLIQDLKTERDDLSRDLSVSQTKVENLESQVLVLTRRMEIERKEAWAAKTGENEVRTENGRLVKEIDEARLQIIRLKEDLAIAQEELENRDVFHLHRKDVSMPRSVEQLNFMNDEDEDELAHYEDEEIDDVTFYSDQDDSISSTSLNDRTSVLPPITTIFGHPASSNFALEPQVAPQVTQLAPHKRSSSLEQGWSFPKGARPAPNKEPVKVDRFFECLEILDSDVTSQSPFTQDSKGASPRDQYGFFAGQDSDDDDDDFPFMLPSQSAPIDRKLEQLPIPGAVDVTHFQLTPPLSPATPSISISSYFDRESKEPATHFVVTPKKSQQSTKSFSPSMIPKPSPPRFDPVAPHLATPTSIPRVKISPVSPTPQTRNRDPRYDVKSPTKLPKLRAASNNTQSASSHSNGFQMLKGPSMGFTALANYLPWTPWSGEGTNVQQPQVVVRKTQPTTSTTGSLRLSTRKGASTANQKNTRSDQLMLL